MNQQDIEQQLNQIQQSTKTLFKSFSVPHEIFRQRFKGYYNWHLWPYHNLIHWLTLSCYIFSFIFIFLWQFGAFSPQAQVQATAGIAKMLNYQGKLTNLTNIPQPDGSYNFTISVYDIESGGSCLWTWKGTCGSKQAVAVNVSNGIFSVMLGDTATYTGTNALTLDFNSDAYYLSVDVGGDGEMSPRKRIGAVGYAYNADTVDGKNETDFALLAGRNGGQTLIGGTAANNILTFQGNSAASSNTLTDPAIQLKVGDSGSTMAITILNNGNVGIGDTSPDTLLDLLSSSAANTQITITNTNVGNYDPQIGFQFAEGTNTFTLGVDDSDSDKFKISSSALGTSDRVVIDSNGKVGINISSPSYILDVSTSTANDRGINIAQTAATGTNYAGYFSATGSGATTNYGIYTTASGASNNYALITDGGNVGIGDSTPGQKLSVAGTFGIRETGVSPQFYTILQGGDQSTDLTYTLPTAYPAVTGYVLSSTDAGAMSWVAQSSGPWTDGGAYLYPTAYESLRVYDSGGTDYIDIAHDGTDVTVSFANTAALNIDIGVLDLSNQTVDVTLDNDVDALNFDSNTLSIDASNDRVGIGTTTPAGPLDVAVGTASEATGGAITHSDGYTYHTFTSSGTFTVPANLDSTDVEVLVVAGGGAGGTWVAAGGGAGGILYEAAHAVTAQAYLVTVGAGAPLPSANGVGGNGSNSVFDTMTAIGGGGGGAYNSLPGVAGGSGGGGAAFNTSGGAGTVGPPRQGYDGGSYPSAIYSDNGAGGGGGAGAVGENGDQSRMGPGGDGGVGVEYSQFAAVGGSPAGWFGGGGGGSGYTPGSGGSGGGGVGGDYNNHSQTAGNGVANTGGGGGGGWDVPSGAPGGAGGSGIVIIRYLTPAGALSSALLVNSIGNVGINTSSPGAKLDILYNFIGVTTDNNKVVTANTTGATFNTTAGNLANYGAYFTNTSTESAGSNTLTNIALYLAASGADTNYALITNGGNVGIGTATPAQLLSVAGIIESTIGGFKFPDGSIQTTAKYSKSFVIDAPQATSDYSIWRVPYAITITAIHVLCVDGTNVIGGLDEADANGLNAVAVDSDITATAGTSTNDDGTLTNPSIDANDYINWHTTSISGTPTAVTITFEYTVN